MDEHNDAAKEPSERALKRKQFLAPATAPTRSRGRSWRRWIMVGIAALAVLYILNVLAGAIATPWGRQGSDGAKVTTAVQVNSAGEIRIPAVTLADGAARFYEFASPSRGQIRFFLVRDSQGVIRSAIDNCEVCFEGGRGYTQQGDEMVCGKCGQSFPIDRIGEAAGGCHPIALSSSRSGDEMVIRAVDLGGSNPGNAVSAPFPRQLPSPGTALATAPGGGGRKVVTSVQPSPAGEIRIAAASLAGGAAQFYEYADPSGKRIRLFAIADGQGSVRTALDGCEECYQANKGYTQRGREMLCGECGKSSPVAAIDQAAGGCHPTYLPSVASGDAVVIKVADVVAADARTSAVSAGLAPPDVPQDERSRAASPVQASATGEIHIPAGGLADGASRFYEYTSPFGGQVRFFVVQDSQGGLHAAIDNCEECYQARKGYAQRGQEMVCQKCGKTFPIASIREGAGGCRPIGLPVVRTGAELVVKAVDLVSFDARAASAGRGQTGLPRF